MSLWPRTLLGRTVLLIAFLLAASQFAWLVIYRIYNAGPRAQQVAAQIAGFASLIRTSLESLPEAGQQNFLRQFARREGIRVVPVPSIAAADHEPAAPFLRTINQYLRIRAGADLPLMIERGTPQAIWIKARFGVQDYWIIVPRNRLDEAFPWQWIGWGVLGLLLAIIGAYMIVSRINQPLQQLTVAAGRLGRGESPEPVDETGPQELRDLSRTFNRMTQELQRLEADRTLLLAGVSHDLRTPLARLRLAVELMDTGGDSVLKQGMVQDIEDMDGIINQFLDFARASGGEVSVPTDLNRLVTEVAERFVRLGKPIKIEVEALPELRLKPLAMQRLITNLIDNALRYGSGEEVEIHTRMASGAVILSVLDRGPGVPTDQVERLKQPFTRLDSARTGSSGAGLGLAIVDRIAKMHYAKFKLLPRQDGGLEASVELPMYSSQPEVAIQSPTIQLRNA